MPKTITAERKKFQDIYDTLGTEVYYTLTCGILEAPDTILIPKEPALLDNPNSIPIFICKISLMAKQDVVIATTGPENPWRYCHKAISKKHDGKLFIGPEEATKTHQYLANLAISEYHD